MRDCTRGAADTFYAEELCANALRFHGYALVGIVHIGRSSTQELCLKSAGISLCHALLQAKDTEWELVDQASTLGICYVNGDRITRHTVVPGDVIYLGNVIFADGKGTVSSFRQIADTRPSLKFPVTRNCPRKRKQAQPYTT